MKENYATNAANWWTNLIQQSYPDYLIHELDYFKNLLTQNIQNSITYHGFLRLSTYDKTTPILNDIAMQSMLPVDIPKGFEMMIVLDEIRVYNSSGILVNSF